MAELIYHAEAKAETREAAEFYESCRPGLGRDFLSAIESAIERILQFPEGGQRIRGAFRRVLLRRFPYGIIYSLQGEAICIVAVMHLARKPGYWTTRLEDAPPER